MKASHEFDILAQDVYNLALEELVKHIGRKKPDIDVYFLVESLEEQKKEVKRLLEGTEIHIFPTDEDVGDGVPAPQDPYHLVSFRCFKFIILELFCD